MDIYTNFLKSYKEGMEHLLSKEYSSASRKLLKAADSLFDFGSIATGDEGERLKSLAGVIYELEEEIDDLIYQRSHPTTSNSSDDILPGIAGNKELKREIKRLIINPMSNIELYSKFRKHRGGGILLYGVPGTGKSRIAREIAREIDAEFFEIKCSTVISKWFGESERNIKDIFDEARKSKCSIIFFDEFEALSVSRDNEQGAIRRVVSELLAQIQGFEENSNTLILLAATNRPWDIDSAFLRPGRFSSKLFIPLPDLEARIEIVRQELEDVPLERGFSFSLVASATDGFSSADVVEFVERLKDVALERSIDGGVESPIKNDDIAIVANIVKTSVLKGDLNRVLSYMKA